MFFMQNVHKICFNVEKVQYSIKINTTADLEVQITLLLYCIRTHFHYKNSLISLIS